jgi:Amt family ammonium transporter
MNTGDTAWLLVSAALVMLMTPGLALFYGGMVRAEERPGNDHAVVHRHRAGQRRVGAGRLQRGVRPDVGGVLGDLSWAGLSGVGLAPNADYAATVPHLAFMAFQMCSRSSPPR